MELHKQRRKRGVILSIPGFHKLQEARNQVEILENDGARLTIEELSYRTQLAPFTVSKVLAREEGVDKQTLEYFFRAFSLELTPNDYVRAGNQAEAQRRTGTAIYLIPSPQSPVTPVRSTEGTSARDWLPSPQSPKNTDWGEVVDVSIFCGRSEEVSKLEYWIIHDRCRLVAVLGMGGIVGLTQKNEKSRVWARV